MTDLITTTLDRMRTQRADLRAQVETLRLEMEERDRKAELLLAEVRGLDRGIEALEQAAPVEPAAPERRERLNIAEAVVGFIGAAGVAPAIAEIAAGIKRKPSQVSQAIMRLSGAGRVELVPGTSDRYRVRAAEQREAAE